MGIRLGESFEIESIEGVRRESRPRAKSKEPMSERSSNMHHTPVRADEELTRRVSVLTGKSLRPLPLRWSDSANWLWRSDELSPQLLKLARTSPATDLFWRGLHALFGFDRWQIPEAMTRVPSMLPPHLPLAPMPLTCLGDLQGAPLWSLPWRRADPPTMDAAMAGRFGSQLALMHQESLPGFGHPAVDVMPLSSWPERARVFVARHPNRSLVAQNLEWPQPSVAVWSLPDLRCDQFLKGATDWLWSDWEALVWAPLEFDLCLLELLLENASQRDAFMTAYTRRRTVPDLAHYRPGMRALALLLSLHGEQGHGWIDAHPHWLKD